MGLVTLGLNLTGDLLAWDQNSFWATSIRVAYPSHLPLIGPWLSKLAIGGPQFGTLTITRFLALHIGVCSAVCWGWCCSTPAWLRATAWKRSPSTMLGDEKGTVPYWPQQASATRRPASSCWPSSWGCRRATALAVRRPASGRPGQSGRRSRHGAARVVVPRPLPAS